MGTTPDHMAKSHALYRLILDPINPGDHYGYDTTVKRCRRITVVIMAHESRPTTTWLKYAPEAVSHYITDIVCIESSASLERI